MIVVAFTFVDNGGDGEGESSGLTRKCTSECSECTSNDGLLFIEVNEYIVLANGSLLLLLQLNAFIEINNDTIPPAICAAE